MQKADQGPDKNAEVFRQEYLCFIRKAASRFFGRGLDAEELEQAGALGLSEALRRFDSARGTAFLSFAFPFIEGAIRERLRKNHLIRIPRSTLVGLQETAGGLNDGPNSRRKDSCPKYQAEMLLSIMNEPVYLDTRSESLADERNIENEIAEKLTFQNLLKKLDNREAAVIALRYYKGLSQKRAATVLNVAQSTVSKTEKQALSKLRFMLSERDCSE